MLVGPSSSHSGPYCRILNVTPGLTDGAETFTQNSQTCVYADNFNKKPSPCSLRPQDVAYTIVCSVKRRAFHFRVLTMHRHVQPPTDHCENLIYHSAEHKHHYLVDHIMPMLAKLTYLSEYNRLDVVARQNKQA